MAEWKSDAHKRNHFALHAYELGCRSLREYDMSAQSTLDVGTYFEYYHDDSAEWRTGCYDRATGRLTVLDQDDRIVTHFRCPEWYIRDLTDNTYD